MFERPSSPFRGLRCASTAAFGLVLVHASGIEGLIFGSWIALLGEGLSCVGPAEGLSHGCVKVGDELLDCGFEHVLADEIATSDELSHQNGKPDFDLIEP